MASCGTLRQGLIAAAIVAMAVPALAQSPTGNSPTQPTPYNWNIFHSGGADTEHSTATVTPQTGQLQGVPTGVNTVGGVQFRTETPSMLLGNFNNGLPQVGDGIGDSVGSYLSTADPPTVGWKWNFRQHDSAGDHVLQWLAPFVYNLVPTPLSVDDSAATGFTQTGFGAAIPDATAVGPTPTTGEFIDSTSAAATATWSIGIPAAGTGPYYVVAHIPSDVTQPAPKPALTLSTQVTYTISYTDPAGAPHTVTVTASQAQLGELVLTGAIDMLGGTTTTITVSDPALPGGDTLVADSAGVVFSNASPVVADDQNANNIGPQTFTVLNGTWTSIAGTTTSVAPTAAFGE
jgi:hypothetical protein